MSENNVVIDLDTYAPLTQPGERRDLKTVVPRGPAHNGRPKGARNMSTLLREAIVNKQENIMLKHLPRIVKKACDMAEKGDISAIKMIMDRMVPVAKETTRHESNRAINIIINGAESPVHKGVTINGQDFQSDVLLSEGELSEAGPGECSQGSEDCGAQERQPDDEIRG